MDIKKLYQLHKNKNEIIIKRKFEKLDFTIKVGQFIKRSLRISVDDKNLYIGNRKIKIKNLTKMYINEMPSNFNTYSKPYLYVLEFEQKNSLIFNPLITLNYSSEEDLNNIDKLFRYFIFSNEISYNAQNAQNYEFLISNDQPVYKRKLNEYSEEQKDAKTIKINSREYSFIRVLPKKYYKKYSNKDYLLFETKYKNLNYMDVWKAKNKDEAKSEKTFLLIVVVILIIFSILSGIFLLIFAHYLQQNFGYLL